MLAASPGVAAGQSVYTLARKLKKKIAGTAGEDREDMARWLAYHFMTSDCPAARKFIEILFRVERTEPFERLEYDELTHVLAEKMKSV